MRLFCAKSAFNFYSIIWHIEKLAVQPNTAAIQYLRDLGVKIFGGQKVHAGEIIVRQRGTKFRAGKNVRRAEDDTLFAMKNGIVKFLAKKVKLFTGKLQERKFVSIEEAKR